MTSWARRFSYGNEGVESSDNFESRLAPRRRACASSLRSRHADFILTVILSARLTQKSSTWPTILESSSHFEYSVILFFIVSSFMFTADPELRSKSRCQHLTHVLRRLSYSRQTPSDHWIRESTHTGSSRRVRAHSKDTLTFAYFCRFPSSLRILS